METINDRIEVIVNELFEGNKAAFAKAIGLAPTAISSYLGKQRRSRPSVDMVINIVKVTGVSYSWLLTGEGAMMQQGAGITHGGDPPSPPPASITYYPSVSGAAGDIPFTEDNELEHLAMQVPTFEDCRLAVNVYGNSMAPGIKSGDIVLMSEWRERYLTILPARAREILQKWGGLPALSNQKCNLALKVIAPAAGIAKRLTLHMARHTFATWELHHGIDLKTVSATLGHSSVTITEIYAKTLEADVKMKLRKLGK